MEYSGKSASVGVQQALGSVTLVWNANKEPDLAGYRLHYGTAPGLPDKQTIDVGNVTRYVARNLPLRHRYYFTVTAYNSRGQESPAAKEVSTVVNVELHKTP